MEFNPSESQVEHVAGSSIPIKETVYCTGRYWSLSREQNILGLLSPIPSPVLKSKPWTTLVAFIGIKKI